MEKFAYASPATVKDAAGMLSNKWGEVEVLAGGTDLISMMKEYLVAPEWPRFVVMRMTPFAARDP